MRKIILPCLLFFSIISFGQNTKVSGKSFRPIKYKLVVANSFDKKYYNGNQILDSTAVKNGVFNLIIPNRSSDIPYAYTFSDKINPTSFYQSNVFFINPKTKNIVIGKENRPDNFEVVNEDVFIKTEVSKFQNYFSKLTDEKENVQKSLREEFDKFENKEKIPQEFWDKYQSSEKEFSVKEDNLLLDFVKTNPNSFVALWKLIEKFERNGYAKNYDEIFNLLSPQLKSKPTAETLRLAIKEASIFQIGSDFPVPKMKNTDESKADFFIPKAKYTLVDFWFSSCKPCLEQMPNYIQLYDDYQAKGFQIIGIATDREKFKANLESTITKFKIPWNNYWDKNGKQSSDWTITSFPTNYLLDENGKIMAKNISEKQLSELLKEKLQ